MRVHIGIGQGVLEVKPALRLHLTPRADKLQILHRPPTCFATSNGPRHNLRRQIDPSRDNDLP
jgi:hypothetical protein